MCDLVNDCPNGEDEICGKYSKPNSSMQVTALDKINKIIPSILLIYILCRRKVLDISHSNPSSRPIFKTENHKQISIFFLGQPQKYYARGYKTFFVLNSVEHEISNAHKYTNIKKFSFCQAQISGECYFSCS